MRVKPPVRDVSNIQEMFLLNTIHKKTVNSMQKFLSFGTNASNLALNCAFWNITRDIFSNIKTNNTSIWRDHALPAI